MASSPSDPGPEEAPLPASLRLLKALVLVLLVTMIVGTVVVVGLLTIRLRTPPLPTLPAAIALPDGAKAQAVTFGDGWVAVVTDGGQILVFDAASGALRQSVEIDP